MRKIKDVDERSAKSVTSGGLVRVSISVPPEDYERLVKEAEKDARSVSAQVISLMRDAWARKAPAKKRARA